MQSATKGMGITFRIAGARGQVPLGPSISHLHFHQWEGGRKDGRVVLVTSKWLFHNPGDRLSAALNSNPFIFVTKKKSFCQNRLKSYWKTLSQNQSLLPKNEVLWSVQLGWGITYPSTNHWSQEKWIMAKDGSSLLDPKDQMGTEASPQNEGMQVPKERRNAEKQHNKSLLQVTSLEIFSLKDYYASESRSAC